MANKLTESKKGLIQAAPNVAFCVVPALLRWRSSIVKRRFLSVPATAFVKMPDGLSQP